MNPAHLLPAERTRRILEDLEAIRENLLALTDAIWDSIDHRDLAALDEGVAFLRPFVDKTNAFGELAAELSALIQQYTSVHLDAAEQTGDSGYEQNERIVLELNRDEPHTLDEDFTWKRPHGFILEGRATSGLTTWQRLFELVCRQLYDRDPGRFRSLIEHPDFISNRGRHALAREPSAHRRPLRVADDLYLEANLSANGIRDALRDLLRAYDISPSDLRLFLRQDRDAPPPAD